MTDRPTITDQAADNIHRDAATLVWRLDEGDLDGAAALVRSMDATERGQVAILLAAVATTAATEPANFSQWLAEHTPGWEPAP